MVCCVVVGKQLPLFRSVLCMYIHRQTYSYAFCKCYTHTDTLGMCPLCVHKNIPEEDLGSLLCCLCWYKSMEVTVA